jgi:ABC-type transporter Mla MlaB component
VHRAGDTRGGTGDWTIRIDTVSNPPHAVILIRGEIDAATVPDLASTVESLPDTVTSVELDLDEVSFVDSTGLGVIAALMDRPLGRREPQPGLVLPLPSKPGATGRTSGGPGGGPAGSTSAPHTFRSILDLRGLNRCPAGNGSGQDT